MSATLAIHELAPCIDLAGYWEFPKPFGGDYRLPGHHLILIERGAIRAATPYGRFAARAHDLICFRPAERNHYDTSGDTAFYQIHCTFASPPRHLLTLWLDELGPLPMCVSLGGRYGRARELVEAICQALPHGGATARLHVHAALVELIALASEAHGSGPRAAVPLDRMQRARLRLESGLHGSLSVAEVAREAGLGVDGFIRAFRARFGATPKQHRTRAKLRWAANRLQSTSATVKQVMSELGFRDASAFARLFRRYLGLLPSQVHAHDKKAAVPLVAPAEDRRGLFPKNQHVLPPDAAADLLAQFRVR